MQGMAQARQRAEQLARTAERGSLDGAAHLHRGRQQPAGAADRADRRMTVAVAFGLSSSTIVQLPGRHPLLVGCLLMHWAGLHPVSTPGSSGWMAR